MGYKQKHPYIAQIGYILRYAIRSRFERLTWMFKVRDCRHICLFCEYYEMCKTEEHRKKRRKRKNEYSEFI